MVKNRRNRQDMLSKATKYDDEADILNSKRDDIMREVNSTPWDKNGTEILKGDWIVTYLGRKVEVVDIVGRIVHFIVGEISDCEWSAHCTLTSPPMEPPMEPPKYVDRYGIPVNVKDKVLFIGDLRLGPQRVVAASVSLEGEAVFQLEEDPTSTRLYKYKSHQIVKVYQ